MLKIIKMLFCEHDYSIPYATYYKPVKHRYNTYRKVYVWKCSKCGKCGGVNNGE